MDGIVKTECNKCIHDELCKFKDLYKRVCEAVEDCTVGLDSPNPGEMAFAKVRDVKFVRSTAICSYYTPGRARL